MAGFRDLAPLTLKPAVWVINVDEEATDASEQVAAVRDVVPATDEVVALSAEIEEEAARLDPDDRAELLQGLGLGAGATATTPSKPPGRRSRATPMSGPPAGARK